MSRGAVYLETFGCQMNELDSELVAAPEQADIVLYNTCSVREHAEQKVWSRLGLDRLRKAQRPDLVVGVLGCMAERDGEDLLRRMPQVDVLCGPGELDKLPLLLDNALRTKASLLSEPAEHTPAAGAAAPALISARQVALQGSSSRRSATLAAAQDTLELLDLSRAVSPGDFASTRSAYVRSAPIASSLSHAGPRSTVRPSTSSTSASACRTPASSRSRCWARPSTTTASSTARR
jgi:tRNA-2-methylthio-N6-dimethylallyladenosine synthase